MTRQKNTTTTNTTKAQSIGVFFNRHAALLACVMLVAVMMCGTAFASGADALWNTISGLIQTWVTRLGRSCHVRRRYYVWSGVEVG